MIKNFTRKTIDYGSLGTPEWIPNIIFVVGSTCFLLEMAALLFRPEKYIYVHLGIAVVVLLILIMGGMWIAVSIGLSGVYALFMKIGCLKTLNIMGLQSSWSFFQPSLWPVFPYLYSWENF